jgi:hypothetical protein
MGWKAPPNNSDPRKEMNAGETIKYLETLSLSAALWWFIENMDDAGPDRTQVFFYLRERVRRSR